MLRSAFVLSRSAGMPLRLPKKQAEHHSATFRLNLNPRDNLTTVHQDSTSQLRPRESTECPQQNGDNRRSAAKTHSGYLSSDSSSKSSNIGNSIDRHRNNETNELNYRYPPRETRPSHYTFTSHNFTLLQCYHVISCPYHIAVQVMGKS